MMSFRFWIVYLTLVVDLAAGYVVNKSYVYEYESYVQVSYYKHRVDKLPVKYQITSTFRLDVVGLSGSVVQFIGRISNVQPAHSSSSSTLKALLNEPFYFKLDVKTGQLVERKFSKNDLEWSLIYKRSLIDHFGFDPNQEKLFGKCENVKKLTLRNDTNTLYTRFEMSDCVRTAHVSGEFKRKENILNSLVDRVTEYEHLIHKNEKENNPVISTITSTDDVKVYVEFNPTSFQEIKTRQAIGLVEEVDSSDEHVEPFDQLESESESRNLLNNLNSQIVDKLAFIDDNKNLKNEKKFQKRVKKMKAGTLKTCKSFMSMIRTLRTEPRAYTNGLFQTLINKSNLAKSAIELYTSAQTDETREALNDGLKIDQLDGLESSLNAKESQLIEEYLTSLSLNTHPAQASIDATLTVLNNSHKMQSSRLGEKTALTLGSLISLRESNQPAAIRAILTKMSQCKEENIPCRVGYLQAVQNSQSTDALQTLSAHFGRKCTTGRKLSAALDEYCAWLLELFTNSHETFEQRMGDLAIELFSNGNRTYSNELRLHAMVFLFEKKFVQDESQLERILHTVRDEMANLTRPNREFLNFVKVYLTAKMNVDFSFRDTMNRLMRRLAVSEFFLHTQIGFSNIFSSPVKNYSKGSLSYKLKQLFTESGYLRSLQFSVFYDDSIKPSVNVDFLKLEIYGSNLDTIVSSFLGSSDENAESSLNVHLSIMGQKLKIYELFKGQKALMSLMWSLPAKLKSLFAINFLVYDQNEYLMLANGMSVRVETLGAVSFDMSARAEVSLWSQYAKTRLRTSPALSIEQRVSLINDFKPLATLETSFGTEFAVDFDLNVDFSTSPYGMCVKMDHGKFYLNEQVKLYDGQSGPIAKLNKRMLIHGSSYMFSRRAVQSC